MKAKFKIQNKRNRVTGEVVKKNTHTVLVAYDDKVIKRHIVKHKVKFDN